MPAARTTKPRKAPRTPAEASTTPPAKKRAVNGRAKGAAKERELAALFREAGIEARRGQQFSGGANSPDVRTALDWLHVESKATKGPHLTHPATLAQWDAQAIRDAGPGRLPVVCHTWNRGPWMVRILVPTRAPVWMLLSDFLAPGELDAWRRVAQKGSR